MRRHQRRSGFSRSRSLLYTCLLLGGWCVLLLAAAGLLAFFGQGSFLGGRNLSLAVVCSLVAVLFLAAFLLRRETIVLPVEDPEDFLRRARRLLEEYGCVVDPQEPGCLVGRPRFLAFVLGGNFRVELKDGQARLVGPRAWIETFPKHLRWQRVFDPNPAAEDRKEDRFHKRVRLRLTLNGRHLEAFVGEALLPLLQQGGEQFSLDLLVQGDTGVSERFLEGAVRPWLLRSESVPLLQFDLVHRLTPGAADFPDPDPIFSDAVPGSDDTYIDRE